MEISAWCPAGTCFQIVKAGGGVQVRLLGAGWNSDEVNRGLSAQMLGTLTPGLTLHLREPQSASFSFGPLVPLSHSSPVALPGPRE